MNTTRDATYNVRVARAVRLIRSAKGLSQRQLANALGVSQVQVCRLEKGTNEWSVSQLQTACAAMGMDTAELLGIVHTGTPADAEAAPRLAS